MDASLRQWYDVQSDNVPDPFAHVTIYPSCVEFRDHTGAFGSEPVNGDQPHEFAIGKVVGLLIERHGDLTIQLRRENWDD